MVQGERHSAGLPGSLRSLCPDVCLSLACLASVCSSRAAEGVGGYQLLETVLGVGVALRSMA